MMEVKQVIRYQEAISVLIALDHEFRVDILEILTLKESMPVNEILGLVPERYTQAELSVHLAILRAANLVKYRHIGRQRFYYLNILKLERISQSIKKFNQ